MATRTPSDSATSTARDPAGASSTRSPASPERARRRRRHSPRRRPCGGTSAPWGFTKRTRVPHRRGHGVERAQLGQDLLGDLRRREVHGAPAEPVAVGVRRDGPPRPRRAPRPPPRCDAWCRGPRRARHTPRWRSSRRRAAPRRRRRPTPSPTSAFRSTTATGPVGEHRPSMTAGAQRRTASTRAGPGVEKGALELRR